MWPENDSWSSIHIPRNLTDFSGHVCPTRHIVLFPIYRLFQCSWLFGFLKKMYFDFLAFIVSLLQLNHCSDVASSLFACLKRLNVSEPDIWNVQSSAKSKVIKFVAFAKSFIKKRKSKGPRQLPCGIPELQGSLLELIFVAPETVDKWRNKV